MGRPKYARLRRAGRIHAARRPVRCTPLAPARPPVYASAGTVLLDTARPDADNRRSLAFTRPRRVLATRAPGEVAGLLREAEAELRAGRYVAGLLTYEAGVALAGLPIHVPDAVPLVWLGVYDTPADAPEMPALPVRIGAVRAGWSEAAYTERHEAVRALIREGDVYQVTLTFPLRFAVDGPSERMGCALYAALRARQPVAFGAYLDLGDGVEVVSLSPELFFRTDGARIVTKPMKGTVRRGATAAEDDRLRAGLAADEKNRAENLMIVDLLRNDLAVVCEPGSVRVPALFETEAHPTLLQMTSTVEGTLRADVGFADVLAALFPSGSITGAPKRRAMERIAALETGPRGAYCGAIGYAGPNGAG